MNGFGVMIAAAGMAAHLAGAVAANTTLPVIGIPVSAKNLGGLDALLAVAQRALENNATIKLAQVSCDMQVVLDITKVYKVFEIYPTIEEAVNSFKKDDL